MAILAKTPKTSLPNRKSHFKGQTGQSVFGVCWCISVRVDFNTSVCWDKAGESERHFVFLGVKAPPELWEPPAGRDRTSAAVHEPDWRRWTTSFYLDKKMYEGVTYTRKKLFLTVHHWAQCKELWSCICDNCPLGLISPGNHSIYFVIRMLFLAEKKIFTSDMVDLFLTDYRSTSNLAQFKFPRSFFNKEARIWSAGWCAPAVGVLESQRWPAEAGPGEMFSRWKHYAYMAMWSFWIRHGLWSHQSYKAWRSALGSLPTRKQRSGNSGLYRDMNSSLITADFSMNFISNKVKMRKRRIWWEIISSETINLHDFHIVTTPLYLRRRGYRGGSTYPGLLCVSWISESYKPSQR